MSTAILGRCWHCGQPFGETDLSRELRCPGCAKPVHACRNCRFYRPGRNNDCLEPVADHVADKVAANFCDYFQPHEAAYGGETAESADKLRAAAEDLFK
jgi:hypothetical protein